MNLFTRSSITLCAVALLTVSTNHLSAQSSAKGIATTTSSELLIPDFNEAPPAARALTYRLLPLRGNTWGYDILTGGRVLIHQDSMPGKVNGSGFRTKDNARKTAEAIILLLADAQVAPVLTIDQLTRMDIN